MEESTPLSGLSWAFAVHLFPQRELLMGVHQTAHFRYTYIMANCAKNVMVELCIDLVHFCSVRKERELDSSSFS